MTCGINVIEYVDKDLQVVTNVLLPVENLFNMEDVDKNMSIISRVTIISPNSIFEKRLS